MWGLLEPAMVDGPTGQWCWAAVPNDSAAHTSCDTYFMKGRRFYGGGSNSHDSTRLANRLSSSWRLDRFDTRGINLRRAETTAV